MPFAQIFPKRQLLKILFSRTKLSESSVRCRLRILYLFQLDTHFLAIVQLFTAESMCASSKLCSSNTVADLSRRCVQAG